MIQETPTPRRSMFLLAGTYSWAFVGVVLSIAIVVAVLATISSVVLPLAFAAILAVLFRPVAAKLEQRRMPSPLAAGSVVIVLLAVASLIVWMVVDGIVSQADQLLDEAEQGLAEVGVTDESIDELREAIENLSPSVAFGFVKVAVAGISSLGGFIAGVLLSVLIMYYLLKDGPKLRRSLIDRVPEDRGRHLDAFVGDACFVLRRYWLGRSIVSAVVASVVGIAALVMGLPLVGTIVAVTFVGGYIPYIGAVIGGLLAVIIALGSNGLAAAIAMLVVVLVANLLIENIVEPAITGRTLQIHPLMVLLVTTVGGIVGGLVGLVMAVPLTVIAGKALHHFREAFTVDTDAIRESLRRKIHLPDDGSGEPPAPLISDAPPT